MKRDSKKRLLPPEDVGAPGAGMLTQYSKQKPLDLYAKHFGGRQMLVDVARELSANEGVRLVCQYWDKLTKSQKNKTSLDELCEAAKVSPKDFISEVVGCMHEHNVDLTKAILAASMPSVMEKTVSFAMEEGNFKDREMFHKMTGLLPTPQGSQFAFIQNNQGQGGEPPPPEPAKSDDLPPIEEENIIETPFEEIVD